MTRQNSKEPAAEFYGVLSFLLEAAMQIANRATDRLPRDDDAVRKAGVEIFNLLSSAGNKVDFVIVHLHRLAIRREIEADIRREIEAERGE
jgi:hypothetical protein